MVHSSTVGKYDGTLFSFVQTHVDSKSASAMFELIRKKLSLTPAYIHFLSIFYHLILLPCKQL